MPRAEPSFAIAPRRLMGPGPSNVHPRVTAALALPVVGHLDAQFLRVMDATQELLRFVFQTRNALTFPVSGTGSAGMEAAVANLLEPGDEAIVGVAGYFGARIADVARRAGAVVHRLDRPWGEAFEPGEIRDALVRHPGARLVALVHGETSTGIEQPLPEIGALCRAHDRLLLVDAVATLGGVDLRIDEWSIDCCYAGSQKCLGAPPGLAPITFGPRAVERIRARRAPVWSFYGDALALAAYWSATGEPPAPGGPTPPARGYHHTAPVAMVYALREALAMVREEGLEARFARHARHSRALLAGLGALGFRPLGNDAPRLPVVNAVLLPPELDDLATRRALIERFAIEVAGGLGELAGRIWRVGLMGESACQDHVLALLDALDTLGSEAARPGAGAGAPAARAAYAARA